MKYLFAIAFALTFAGCAATRQAADWLASDKAQKAAINLKTLANAVDCGLVLPAAALSREIARAVEAGQASLDTTGKVHAVSAAICDSLGGVSAEGASGH
ncbi:MAG: hypothetical protein ACK5JM_00545 [Rhodoblastus sp.]